MINVCVWLCVCVCMYVFIFCFSRKMFLVWFTFEIPYSHPLFSAFIFAISKIFLIPSSGIVSTNAPKATLIWKEHFIEWKFLLIGIFSQKQQRSILTKMNCICRHYRFYDFRGKNVKSALIFGERFEKIR